MKSHSFKHNYHDSHLISFTLGPRRELALEVALDSVWNKDASSASLRFGGIENYDDVVAFFQALPKPSQVDAYIAEIGGLEYLKAKPNTVNIEIADHGHVNVCSQHITEL